MRKTILFTLLILGVLISSCDYNHYEQPELINEPNQFEFKILCNDSLPKKINLRLDNSTRDGYLYGNSSIIDTIIKGSHTFLITKESGRYAYVTLTVKAIKDDDIRLQIKCLKDTNQIVLYRHSSCLVGETSIGPFFIEIR